MTEKGPSRTHENATSAVNEHASLEYVTDDDVPPYWIATCGTRRGCFASGATVEDAMRTLGVLREMYDEEFGKGSRDE